VVGQSGGSGPSQVASHGVLGPNFKRASCLFVGGGLQGGIQYWQSMDLLATALGR
jgi:hypothetical protein